MKSILLILFTVPTLLVANPKPSAPDSQVKTKIDLDQIDVTGQQKTPDSSMIDQKSISSDESLITIRKNWREEILLSPQELTD